MSSNTLSIKVNLDFSAISRDLEKIKKKMKGKNIELTDVMSYINSYNYHELSQNLSILEQNYSNYATLLSAITQISSLIKYYTNLLSINLIEFIKTVNSLEKTIFILDVLKDTNSIDLENQEIKVDTVNETVSISEETCQIKDIEKYMESYFNIIMNNINDIKKKQNDNREEVSEDIKKIKEELSEEINDKDRSSKRLAWFIFILSFAKYNPETPHRHLINPTITNEIHFQKDIKDNEIIDDYNDFIVCEDRKSNSTDRV